MEKLIALMVNPSDITRMPRAKDRINLSKGIAYPFFIQDDKDRACQMTCSVSGFANCD